MSKYKKKTNNIWVILAMLIVLIGGIGGIGYLTNWFTSDVKTFTVEYAGRQLVRDCTDLKVEPDSMFKINTLSEKTPDYTVKIYASGTKEKYFENMIGEEKISWYENIVSQKGMNDFTEYFDIEKTADAFTLKTIGFQTILEKRFAGQKITGPMKLPEEVFRIEITLGKTTMKLGFQPYVKVTGASGNADHRGVRHEQIFADDSTNNRGPDIGRNHSGNGVFRSRCSCFCGDGKRIRLYESRGRSERRGFVVIPDGHGGKSGNCLFCGILLYAERLEKR